MQIVYNLSLVDNKTILLSGGEIMDKEQLQIQQFINEKVPVNIIYNDDSGVWYWSVAVNGTDWWLDSFDTKEDAVKFCEDNGLPVINIFE